MKYNPNHYIEYLGGFRRYLSIQEWEDYISGKVIHWPELI